MINLRGFVTTTFGIVINLGVGYRIICKKNLKSFLKNLKISKLISEDYDMIFSV